VLQLVVEGRTNAAIAQALSLSPKTVETYRARIMKKLKVSRYGRARQVFHEARD